MENNTIGNVPNLSAEMDNDISLLSVEIDRDRVTSAPVTIEIGSHTGSYSVPFGCEAWLVSDGTYRPDRIKRFVYSAPLTVNLTCAEGIDAFGDIYTIQLQYVGCIIPWFLSQTCAYTELGDMIDCTVSSQFSSGNAYDVFSNVYTFSYMQFSYIAKWIYHYSKAYYFDQSSPKTHPFGGITAIYAEKVTKSRPYSGYTTYNDNI